MFLASCNFVYSSFDFIFLGYVSPSFVLGHMFLFPYFVWFPSDFHVAKELWVRHKTRAKKNWLKNLQNKDL